MQRAARERMGARHQRLIAAEVPGRAEGRERALPGNLDFDAGRQLVECGRHRLEGARIANWIVIENDQLGTSALRLAPAQPDVDPFVACRGRRGDDPVGEEDRRRLVERYTGGHDRPVRTPHDERPHTPLRMLGGNGCHSARFHPTFDGLGRNARTSASSSTAATPPPGAGNHRDT